MFLRSEVTRTGGPLDSTSCGSEYADELHEDESEEDDQVDPEEYQGEAYHGRQFDAWHRLVTSSGGSRAPS